MTRRSTVLLTIAVLIAVGSLYPFHFRWDAFDGPWLDALLASRGAAPGRGDLLGNIALFVPFGLLGVAGRNRPFGALVALCLTGGFVAAVLQVLQVALPERSPSLFDVWLNVGGIVLGGLIGAWLPRLGERSAAFPTPMSALLLAGLWLAATAMPLVPSIDWQSWKDNLKPILQEPRFEWLPFVAGLAGWFAFGAVLETARTRRTMLVILLACGVVSLALQLLVVTARLEVAEVAAVAAAMGAWILLLPASERARRVIAAGGLLAAWVVAGLSPFAFGSATNAFSWIPFGDYLEGSLATNLAGLMAKAFAVAAICILMRRNGVRAVATALATLLVVSLVELAQVTVAGRQPGITDPLLVVLVAWLAPLLLRLDPDRAEDSTKPPIATSSMDTGRSPRGRIAAVLMALLYGLAVVGVGRAVLGLPSIPYNVNELFYAGGSVLDLLAFAMATLSLGFGAAWAAHRPRHARWSMVALPARVILATLASYVLITHAVTNESVMDIAGSSNTYPQVMNQGLWGDFGITLYSLIGSPTLIDTVEQAIRYCALVGPLFAWLTIFAVTAGRLAGHPEFAGGRRWAFAGVCLVTHVAYFLPWLLLARWVAFIRPSTDNLSELIQDDGAYLYVLMVLIAMNACLPGLARALNRRPGTVFLVGTVVLVPVGWWLVLAGLGSPVEKYGNVFRGVDFLLGPDRATRLPEWVLFSRWTAVQLGLVGVARFGMWLFERWAAPLPLHSGGPRPDPAGAAPI